MGKILTETVMRRRLLLDNRDYALHAERSRRKSQRELHPAILPWHERFAARLDPCPYCGEQPRYNVIFDDEDGYEYKFNCCEKGGLGCGDWYPQLSRAGLSWNVRARHEKGEPYRIVPHKHQGGRMF